MRELIDLIYSSEILRWAFTGGVIIIFSFIITKNPFQNNFLYWGLNILLVATVLGLLSLSFFYRPGYAMFYDKMQIGNNCIFLFEESNFHEDSDDAVSAGWVGRLHVLDKKSGVDRKSVV